MRHFSRWFCGYVCVCLCGRHINRFLNLCSRHGIHLWQICFDLEQKVRVNLLLKDFYLIKPFLKKTRTKLHIVKKKGFPFWCHKHPRLKWFFILCLCILCILGYSHTFIWNIQIDGNAKISSQEIIQLLNEEDSIIGKKSDSIDCPKIEHLIRSNFEEIGWVSVYVDHINLYIEVKESLYDEYNHSPKTYEQYDLVANKDAFIHSIVTRTGKPLVTSGQRVKKGDVLVVGQCAIYDDVGEIKQILKKKADALVIADVVYDFTYHLSEMEIISYKIAGVYNDDMLYSIAHRKLHQFTENLEQNKAIILDKNVKIVKNDRSIVFLGKVFAREEIGTIILMEE